jgi:hypothetical protein
MRGHKMLKFAKVLVCSLLMCLCAGWASADVTYKFEAFTASSLNVHGTFTLTVPTFISSEVSYTPPGTPPATLTGTFFSDDPTLVFSEAGFVPYFVTGDVPPQTLDYVGFAASRGNSGMGVSYFFAPGALSAVGSYDSIYWGDWQRAHLDVSGTSVPLPSTLFLLGSGISGLAMWRRKSVHKLAAVSRRFKK